MTRPTDDRHEFQPLLAEIEERPLNPLGRATFWIIVGALLCALLWMFYGEVDVVVTARGRVIPSGEVKVIQPLSAGVVRSILVAPGDYVERGQILMEIDPSDIDPELASLTTELAQVQIERRRIAALLDDLPFAWGEEGDPDAIFNVQQEIYRTEKNRLYQQVSAKQEVLGQLAEQLAVLDNSAAHSSYMVGVLSERLERLARVREIISHEDFEKSQSDLQQYRVELLSLPHRQAEIRARQEQIRQEIDFLHEENRNRLLLELAEKNHRQSYLQARIEQTAFRSSRQQLAAPVDGHISRLLFHTIGGVVTPAEKLAYLVPASAPLLVRAQLQSKDAGHVRAGMAVSIKVDTFNFQKYGTLNGVVEQIAKDSHEDELLGLVYDLYIAPQQTGLLVSGVDIPLATGMGVTAEIMVGKRRIIEFFIYPLIRYLDEGISVR